MAESKGVKIHITGIVQGVGFRPFIYGLAVRFGLTGWVRNTSAGVDIEADGAEAALEGFAAAIRSELPPLARIDSFEQLSIPARGWDGFEIIASEAVEGAFQPISPDVSICEDCLRELFDPSDRRYRYPFINCTNCGPRFTIITDIPYDRPNTTMAPFAMCPDCASEYADPLDRRFHAQPVACPVCGPQVWLETSAGERLSGKDDAILAARRALADGRILAIKGLGGFHLACDATNAAAVEELRRRKLRVDKPFALMLPDLAAVEMNCFVSAAERELLSSRPRPIVLLRRRPESRIVPEVAPRQASCGVMLPYTSLHYLLLHPDELSLPGLVMTSGNLSEEPIATDNAEARLRLASLADFFLMHDRDIRTRCDDSVVRVFEDRPFPLRRSRGYAPDPVQLPVDVPSILAVGPELKNTFCITRERYAFLSHHIGDMENYETLRSFEDGVAHFERLFRIQPQGIAYDLHPDYLTTRYALQRSQTGNLPAIGVQHHHAHIAACMADNGLDGTRPVIGLAFDGTGYGPDGAIWGGEFLVADFKDYRRPYHLEYFPLPGGDAAIKHPSRTALSLLWSLGLEWEDWMAPVEDMCADDRQTLRTQLEHHLNAPRTSSLGRVFDAAASLAGVRQQVNYEAQAAIEFEADLDPAESGAYRFEVQEETVQMREAFRALLVDLRKGVPIPVVSARFHNGLVELSREVCRLLRGKTSVNEVALSGGVWQNMVLLQRVVDGLRRDGFVVYSHSRVPTNDGGLSLGQAMVGAANFED
ncbi:MAG TPA: carbamoyltransferase HypF [Anaerolineales bacterium]|nr:carbamoyltransferase HypF [Anaerolineales bacterium]